MATMYFVRHGETKLNVGEERLRGWSNVPLDDKGQQQAVDLAEKLRKDIRGSVAQIYSGDFDRCVDTATAIRNEFFAAPIVEMQALRPWNVGEFTGKPLKEAIPGLAEYIRCADTAIPRGESFMDFVFRWMAGLKVITHVALVSAPKPVILVSHTRNARVLMTWIDGGFNSIFNQPPSEYLSKAEDPLAPGQYIKIEWKRGQWVAGDPQ